MIHDTNGAEHQLEPVEPDEDYSWMDRYSRPDDEALSGKALLAAVCAGLAIGIVMAGVVA